MTTVEVAWPELERSGLVNAVEASLRAGRSVVVTGEAGVGKTTVARQSAPAGSAWVQGLDGLSSVALAALSLQDVDPPLDSVARAYAWLHSVADAGTVLVVDDAQWLDEVSAGIVAQAMVGEGLRAVLTVRSGTVLSEDLARTVASGQVDRLVVEPLDSSMVELALELALGSEPDPRVVEEFADRSGGNPLYLRELTLGAVNSGALQRRAGSIWDLTVAPMVPASLSQQLDSRLAHLSPSAREALEIVTVAERLPAQVLSELVGGDAVVGAVDAGWLIEDEGGLRAAHPVVADAVRSRLSRVGRRSCLGRVLDHADEQSVGLAAWLRWVIELDRPIDEALLDRGYEAAVLSFDLELAGQLAALSHERFHSVAHGLRVANDLHLHADHSRACDLVVSLRPLADSPGERALVASHLMRTQGALGKLIGTFTDRRDVADETAAWADEALTGDPYRDLLRGYDQMAVEFGRAEKTVAQYLGHDEPTVRYDTLELLMNDAAEAVMVDQMRDHATAMVEISDPYFDSRPIVFSPLRVLCHALSCEGDCARSVEIVRERSVRVSRSPSPSVRRDVAIAQMMVCADAGLVDEGLEAVAIARLSTARGDPKWRIVSFYDAVLLTLAGRLRDAEDRFADAQSDMESSSVVRGEAEVAEALRLLAVAAADREAGTKALMAQVESLRGSEYTQAEVLALKQLVRLGAAGPEHTRRLCELTDDAIPHYRVVAQVGEARLEGDADRLVQLADRFEEMGNLLDALEALTAAIGLYQTRGDQAAVRRLEARHRELHGQCPGLRWPLAAIAVDAPDLTDRERQVAELAALGWSNREIADELSLSVRTVENNLQRTYAKLGINRRSGLGSALGMQPV